MSDQRDKPAIRLQSAEVSSTVKRVKPGVRDPGRVPNVVKHPGRDQQLPVHLTEEWSCHPSPVRHTSNMRPPTRQLLAQKRCRHPASPPNEITHPHHRIGHPLNMANVRPILSID